LILFNKPYGVLSQFTPEGRWQGLRDHLSVPGVYAAGRLDADSEGLLILTDDGPLQSRIADPRHKLPKTYWAQVEGTPDDAALEPLRHGVDLGDSSPARRRHGSSTNLPACGRAPRRSAFARPSRQTGSNSRSAKAKTARCAG